MIHYNKLNKNYMIILIDAEKALVKIQHPFMLKTASKSGKASSFFNIVKAIYAKIQCQHLTEGEKQEAFPLRSETRQGCPLSLLLFNTVLKFTREEKEKEYKLERGRQILLHR